MEELQPQKLVSSIGHQCLWWETPNRVTKILELDSDSEGRKLMIRDSLWENIWIISYQFYDQDSDNSESKICYINFFGTQNGKNEKGYTRKLGCLWDYSWNTRHISYHMMQKFIVEICIPRSIEKIYLDADWPGKKFFWKEKMWKYLIEVWLIQKQFSQDMEICYVLKT